MENTCIQTEPVKIGEPRLVSPDELAKRLSVSLRTVQRMTARGVIPCVYAGDVLPRYDVKDVIEALKQRDIKVAGHAR